MDEVLRIASSDSSTIVASLVVNSLTADLAFRLTPFFRLDGVIQFNYSFVHLAPIRQQQLPLRWTKVRSCRLAALSRPKSARHHVRHSSPSRRTGLGRLITRIRGLPSVGPRLGANVLSNSCSSKRRQLWNGTISDRWYVSMGTHLGPKTNVRQRHLGSIVNAWVWNVCIGSIL